MKQKRIAYSEKHAKCKYPNCKECIFDDCIMDNNDIAYMLRMRALPKCKECKECATFLNLKGDGTVRCCMLSKRMIGNGIEISPKWCEKRKGKFR